MNQKNRMLARVGRSLRNRGLQLVLAESMTSGALAAVMSQDEHAGDFFMGSVVCYSDQMKKSALGVHSELLENFGGVSAEVTAALVEGLHERFPMADLKIAITGFAFECEATSPANPVGTVFIHIQFERAHYSKRYNLEGDSNSIIDQTIQLVLELISQMTEHLVENNENG